MANYVFLNSSEWPRMPSGEAGEWRKFWRDGGSELEAKNGIPLLWWCLFGEADIVRASIIDNFDIDGPDGEREDFKVESGYSEDTTYPYLVTSREQALIRLTRRRELVLRGIGEKYAPIYDGFVELMERDFGPFILVRTAGLPDPEDAESWLRETAGSMDRLEDGPGPIFESMVADFKTWQNSDPIWLLSGAGADAWPTPALASAFPNGRKPARDASDASTSDSHASGNPARSKILPKFVVEWIGPLFVGGCTVIVYLWMRSIALSALAFAVSVALFVLLVTKFNR